ncbi:MAG: TonB-dependent receptor [Thermodesulfobacteriota bacterium]|nr:TonB-dependent receptor [Thermodesulfobacteriota bacterium]
MKTRIILCILICIFPACLMAEPIYVVADRISNNAPEVKEEPTAFGQTIDTRHYKTRFSTTEEVLRGANGANVRSIGGLGSYSTISLRGASANQCLVLIDGLRLNSASGGGVDLSKIPLATVERIEIIRGSDSAMFGESAMGGVVNIITKDPGERPYGDVSATWGEYGIREYRVNAGGLLYGPVGAGLNFTSRHADNTYEFENTRGTQMDTLDDYTDKRKNNGFDDMSITAKLSARMDTWNMRAMANHYTADKEMPGIITFPTPLASQTIKKDTCSLRSSKTLFDDLDIHAGLGMMKQKDTYTDPGSRIAPLSIADTLSRQADLGTGYTLGFITVSPKFAYQEETLDDLSVGDKKRIIRSFILTTDLLYGPVNLITTVRRDDNSAFDPQKTYRTGVSWSVLDWLVFKANIGKGYRFPSFYELYYNHGFFAGNQGLTPETSVSRDAGLDISTDNFGIQANLFDQRYDDLIVYILQSGFYYKPFNISRARARGYEVYAWLEPIDGIRLSGNYTYNRMLDDTGEINRDNNQIPGRPRNTANLQLDLSRKIRDIALGLYASYNYTEGNFLTRSNTKKLDARRIINAGVNAKINDNLFVNLEVKNIFDKQVSDLLGFPLEGRTAFLTLRMQM